MHPSIHWKTVVIEVGSEPAAQSIIHPKRSHRILVRVDGPVYHDHQTVVIEVGSESAANIWKNDTLPYPDLYLDISGYPV